MSQEKITDPEAVEGIDVQGILTHLPHRYPFLMVDKVIEYTPGKSLLALKNVTCNEPFFSGHFPKKMVMPGVLILEALAQAMGLLASLSNEAFQEDDNLYYLVGIDKARFKQLVVPGDQVILEINVTRALRNIWRSNAEARVDGNVVASAEIMCAAKEV